MISQSIKEAVSYVIDNADHVSIDHGKLSQYITVIHEEKDKHMKHWLEMTPFDSESLSEAELLHLVVIFNSISFCYWGEPKWTIDFKGEKLDGARGMNASLGKAIVNGYPILDFNYLKDISTKDFANILEGNIAIPLFEERLSILREIAGIIVDQYGGMFSNFVDSVDGDAEKLVLKIAESFSGFHDTSPYKGESIPFYKRAQLLTSDISHSFHGKGLGELRGTERLTACADYKLPQVLRRYGILNYSQELSSKIDSLAHIDRHSVEEVEIRAFTIHAVELLKELLQKDIPNITTMEVNDFIRLHSQHKDQTHKPYHRTRTTAY